MDARDLQRLLKQMGITDSGLAARTADDWERSDQKLRQERRAQRVLAHANAINSRFASLENQAAPLRRLVVAKAINFDINRPAWNALRDWNPRDLRQCSTAVLSGPTATGKTCAGLRWLLYNGGTRPVYIRSTAMSAMGRFNEHWRVTWDGASCLMIDDIGAEFNDSRGNYVAHLDEIADVFSGGLRGLICATRLSTQQFRQRYGDRIWERFEGNWHQV